MWEVYGCVEFVSGKCDRFGVCFGVGFWEVVGVRGVKVMLVRSKDGG